MQDTIFGVLAVPESFSDGTRYFVYHDPVTDQFLAVTHPGEYEKQGCIPLSSFRATTEEGMFQRLDEIEEVYRNYWKDHP